MAGENYFCTISIDEYLADRGRSSGGNLSTVATNPEDYGAWLRGKSVDSPSPGKNQGSYVHAKLLEPREVKHRFAFYPSRYDTMIPELKETVGPRGGKRKEPTGEFVRQDPTDAGKYKPMKRGSSYVDDLHRDFMKSAAGKIIIYPDQQPVVEAMVRAVMAHPEAAELLRPDGLGPEVTGHWTCPVTGELMRIRPDAIRLDERKWIEVKSYTPRGEDDRLDTLDEGQVVKWARQGWARKDALLHDGCAAITGDEWTGHWIVVEAVEKDPRVSVVPSRREETPGMYMLGREGSLDRGIPGYLYLIREAQRMRDTGDFRAKCTRPGLEGWVLPRWLHDSMMFEDAARGEHEDDDVGFVPPIQGATPMEAYDAPGR